VSLPKPYYDEDGITIYEGHVLVVLDILPDRYVQTVVTSPPYWGLRDYGAHGQLGLEKTPQEYVDTMVRVFREVRRVLKDDGTLWLNLGDTYNSGGGTVGAGKAVYTNCARVKNIRETIDSLKPKDLVGIPWRVAFALQADGWYLRSDIIWSKPNPMPESVNDRPTKAHEYLFLLSKSERYFYDGEAIKGEGSMASIQRINQPTFAQQTGGPKDPQNGNRSHRKALVNLKRATDKQRGHGRRHDGFNDRWDSMTKEAQCNLRVNKRSVWTVATQPYPEAHFATYPPKLIEPCILAGSRPGDVVLDCFHGAGTTGVVAQKFGRRYVGIELNKKYINMSLKRLAQMVLPL